MAKKIEIPGLDDRRIEELIQKWRMFGMRRQKGEQVVSFLGHFYSTDFSLELRPQINVPSNPFIWIRQDRIKIEFVTPRDLQSLVMPGHLLHELVPPRKFLPTPDAGADLAFSFIERQIHDELNEVIWSKFSTVYGSVSGDHPLSTDLSLTVRDSVLALLKYLEYMVGYCLMDGQGMIIPGLWREYRHLLSLWEGGNFPLGFDHQNAMAVSARPDGHMVKAFVLCAEP